LRLFLDAPNATLIVPSATMAEHLRNQLARAGRSIRPNRILTVDHFIEAATPLKRPSEGLLLLLTASFAPNEFPGYHRALVSLMQEAPADLLPPDVARVARDVDKELVRLGYALRARRLAEARPETDGPLIFDGFFTLAPSDVDLIERLSNHTPVTVTLPDWSGAAEARERLLAAGFAEQRLDKVHREPAKIVLACLSLDVEVEQIAVRILEEAARGRPFREMGVLLRSRDPYAAALESVFARYHIPARFHFPDALGAHPAIQYLSGLVRTALRGWDRAELAALLRMPISGFGATPAGDREDFELRNSLPSSGPPQWWRGLPTGGSAEELADELKAMRHYIPAPEVESGATLEQVQAWRSTAAALDAFDQAIDTAALAFGGAYTSLAQFWPNVETVLSAEKLRVNDGRHNVVNVLDVFEARQWELPIAFVCGLNERVFPQYQREDPLFRDEARRKAKLPTSEDRQLEERFLFDLAVTRATGQTVLSYARYNERGDASLRSFFLEEEGQTVKGPRALPHPQPFSIPAAGPAPNARPTSLSASSIDSFLQCPFQYFSRKTLRLHPRPPKPRDRLNVLLQGQIIHAAIAAGEFDDVFERACAENNIPATYRKEAVRLELLRHYEALLADTQWTLDWESVAEQQFEMMLTQELRVRGRIDRLYTGPRGEAIVVDYKYSTAATLKDRIEGDSVQGGLYLLAAERSFGRTPAGMLYCGLKKKVNWQGWHASVAGLAIGEKTTQAVLREMMDEAHKTAVKTFAQIAEGHREVRPADRKKCEYCDFRDICRDKATGAALEAEA